MKLQFEEIIINGYGERPTQPPLQEYRMEPFDIESAFEWLPKSKIPRTNLLYKVLRHELEAWNQILSLIQKDLHRLHLCLTKNAHWTREDHDLAYALYSNEVPPSWLTEANFRTTNSNVMPLTHRREHPHYVAPTLWGWIHWLQRSYAFWMVWVGEGECPKIIPVDCLLSPQFYFE
eukprot:gene2235-13156_t